MYARHLLATFKQRPGETLDEFLVELKTLTKDCNFANITAEQYRSESTRDINGISSNNIRQRLLENITLDSNNAFDQARSLDVAQQSSNVYSQSKISPFNNTASVNLVPKHSLIQPALSASGSSTSAAVKPKQTCCFCGNDRHPQNRCPAREAQCHKCKKFGHF